MKEIRNRIVVFSPHLDDAVLDVSDHILGWRQHGYHVEIVTVFSAIRGTSITGDMRTYSGIQSRSPRQYEILRKKEDKKAMDLLKVHRAYLDFVEGGIRNFNGKPVYPTFNSLLSGNVSPNDDGIRNKIRLCMRPYTDWAAILAPMGIGGHVDHIIVRKTAESVFPNAALRYFVDYPYALSVRNWKLPHVFKFLAEDKSIIPMSPQKKKLLNCYPSQMPLLFHGDPHYREIVCGAALPKADRP